MCFDVGPMLGFVLISNFFIDLDRNVEYEFITFLTGRELESVAAAHMEKLKCLLIIVFNRNKYCGMSFPYPHMAADCIVEAHVLRKGGDSPV
jgi:hypothetical protein